MVIPTEELHEIDTRTPTVSGTNGNVTAGLSSTEDYWEPRSPPATDLATDLRTSTGADSSVTSTTYQRHEDGDTVITDEPRGAPIHDQSVPTRAAGMSRSSVGNGSPPSSIRHGSITGTRGLGGAAHTGSVNSAPQKSSRWPAWCLCGKKDDGEEAIAPRESPARR